MDKEETKDMNIVGYRFFRLNSSTFTGTTCLAVGQMHMYCVRIVCIEPSNRHKMGDEGKGLEDFSYPTKSHTVCKENAFVSLTILLMFKSV